MVSVLVLDSLTKSNVIPSKNGKKTTSSIHLTYVCLLNVSSQTCACEARDLNPMQKYAYIIKAVVILRNTADYNLVVLSHLFSHQKHPKQ